jgi:hypothetical protein
MQTRDPQNNSNKTASTTKPQLQTFPFESNTDLGLVETIFGIPKSPINFNSKEYQDALDRKGRTLVLQTKYFRHLDEKELLITFAHHVEDTVKNFKYLYLLQLTDSQFQAIHHAFKTSKKTARQIKIGIALKPNKSHYEPNNLNKYEKAIASHQAIYDPEIYYSPIVEGLIIDGLGIKSVNLLLEVLPSTVTTVGLHRVSLEALGAIEHHINKNKLNISVVCSKELLDLVAKRRPALAKKPVSAIKQVTTLQPTIKEVTPQQPSASEYMATILSTSKIKLVESSPAVVTAPVPTPTKLKRSQSDVLISTGIIDTSLPPKKRTSSGPEASSAADDADIERLEHEESYKTFLSSPMLSSLMSHGLFHTPTSPSFPLLSPALPPLNLDSDMGDKQFRI